MKVVKFTFEHPFEHRKYKKSETQKEQFLSTFALIDYFHVQIGSAFFYTEFNFGILKIRLSENNIFR